MGKLILWSFVLLVSLPIAYFVTLPLGLLVHQLLGNPSEVIAADIEGAQKHVLIGLLVVGGSACFFATIHIWLRADVWNRNHEATKLLKKYHKGTLTERERQKFQHYRDVGVLTYNTCGVLRLSDNATDDLR